MTNLSKQQELDEECLFKQLMRQYMEEEGERLLDENERLRADPSAAVPPGLDKKCLEPIRGAFRG